MRISRLHSTATAFIGAATILAIGATATTTAAAAPGTGTGTGTGTGGTYGTHAAAISGVGNFTYDEPGVEGHKIRFSIHARTTADGSTRGDFRFRHLLPNGELVGEGRADVTCLQVSGGTALLTAVVPEGQGNVRNHAFYVKVIDGGRGRPDQVANIQAQNGSERPPERCIDFDVEYPGTAKRYPIERGDYLIRG
jgi:hypothetical protein